MYICLFLLVYFYKICESANNIACGISTGNVHNAEGIYQSSVGDSPWHVGIFYFKNNKYQNICCGSIIHPNVIITAANCVWDPNSAIARSASKFKVAAGKVAYDWNQVDNNVQEIEVRNIHVYPHYRGEVNHYSQNIALLSLVKDFEFNEYIRPVCLDWSKAKQKDLPERKILQSFGWGFREAKYNPILQEAALPFLNLKTCQRKFSSVIYARFITSDKICVTLPEGRQEGDSGSGVILENQGVNYILGVLSAKIANTFSVATRISRYEKWIKEEVTKINRTERCSSTEFTCHEFECIRESLLCDGSKDCDDGSDEDEMHCQKAPGDRFCTLPNQKGGVSYEIEGCTMEPCQLKALSHVPENAIILTRCGKGFEVIDEKLKRVSCNNGQLFPHPPNCKKLCPRLTKENVRTSCSFGGMNIPCEGYARPGTMLSYACEDYYTIKDTAYYNNRLTCDSKGEWRGGLPNCIPKCGIINSLSKATTVIRHGNEAKYGAYPWHVGIFKKEKQDGYKNICGGSLITQNYVLTAAHCTHERISQKKFPKSDIAIAAGKYWRSWDDHEDLQQTREVSAEFTTFVDEIMVKTSYTGAIHSYIHDIAIIKVVKPFDLNSHILPVCLPGLLERSPQEFNATVVGWGKTETSKHSEVLKDVHLPAFNTERCLSEFPVYKSIITYDKFCCYFVNGSGPDLGDSGGGVIRNKGHIYFVQGVVSIKPSDNSIAVMTNVTVPEHLSWIEQIIT